MMKARSNQRTAELTIDIPISLRQSLEDEARRASTTPSAVVCTALARHLGVSLHTLFQVATSGALVTGVYSGAITVGQLLEHGDFGLGTFEGLDGEMVVLDGAVYRVRGTEKSRNPRRRRWRRLPSSPASRPGLMSRSVPSPICTSWRRAATGCAPPTTYSSRSAWTDGSIASAPGR
jgi:hypothetical protein